MQQPQTVVSVPLPEKHVFEDQPDIKTIELTKKEFKDFVLFRGDVERYQLLINRNIMSAKKWWDDIAATYQLNFSEQNWTFNKKGRSIETTGKVMTKGSMPSVPSPEPVNPDVKHVAGRRDILNEGTVNNLEHLIKGSPAPLFKFLYADYPKEEDGGGIFVYLEGLKHPTKGFPYPDAIQAANIAKRLFIGHIRFMVSNPLEALTYLRKKKLEGWLDTYTSAAEITLGQYYLKDYRYTKMARQIRKFIEVFMKERGMNELRSKSFAKTFAHLIESDDAYRFIIEDLASETTTEKLKKDFVGELNRLMRILKERDGRKSMHNRFGSMLFLFRMAFKFGGFKKALEKALDAIDFTQIQMDKADRYHSLRWKTYNFGNKSFKDRQEEFLRIHNGVFPKSYLATLK